MRNERLLILRMIEEGKITAAEGLALLEALEEESPWPEGSETEGDGGAGAPEEAASARAGAGESQEAAGGGPADAGPRAGGPDREWRSESSEEPGSGWEEPAGGRRAKAEDQGWPGFRFDAFRVGEQVMRAVDQIGERLQEVFESSGSWLNDWFGTSHEFPGSASGEVEPSGEPLRVEVHLPNGRVSVESGPDQRYHAEWVVHARGADRERAAERARQALKIEREGGRLVFRAAEGWWNAIGRVDVILRLPAERRYRLDFTLANASLRVAGLQVERLRARLANGTVTVERAQLGSFDVKAANGRIRMDECLARQGRVSTGNGRVEFSGSALRLRLAATNGQVQARLGALSDRQVATLPADGEVEGAPDVLPSEGIRAETINGQVRVQVDEELAARALLQLRSLHGPLEARLPDLNVWHREQGPGRNRLEAAGPRAGSEPFSIEARSRTGSVRVEGWGAGEPWE